MHIHCCALNYKRAAGRWLCFIVWQFVQSAALNAHFFSVSQSSESKFGPCQQS